MSVVVAEMTTRQTLTLQQAQCLARLLANAEVVRRRERIGGGIRNGLMVHLPIPVPVGLMRLVATAVEADILIRFDKNSQTMTTAVDEILTPSGC